MFNFKIMSALLISIMVSYQAVAISPEKMTYLELDNKIIGAYNTNPRKTPDVYVYSMVIFKKSDGDETMAGKAWLLKAKKLITVSCFYECTQAIDKKLYRNAFIWAQRGIKSGTTTGAVGDVSVKSLYKYLNFASSELKNTPMVKNSNQSKLQRQIDDYQTILNRSNIKSTEYDNKLREKLLQSARLLIKKLAINHDIIIVKTPAKILHIKYPSLWQQLLTIIYHNYDSKA